MRYPANLIRWVFCSPVLLQQVPCDTKISLTVSVLCRFGGSQRQPARPDSPFLIQKFGSPKLVMAGCNELPQV